MAMPDFVVNTEIIPTTGTEIIALATSLRRPLSLPDSTATATVAGIFAHT